MNSSGAVLIILLALFAISVAFAGLVARAAERKGREYRTWFILALFFLIPSALIVAALPRVPVRTGPVFVCPDCAEEVQAAAVVCKHCGARLKTLDAG